MEKWRKGEKRQKKAKKRGKEMSKIENVKKISFEKFSNDIQFWNSFLFANS